MTAITISPHDPLVARDGRPAGEGNRLRSLNWVYPSVVAGSLRTLVGKIAAPVDVIRPFDNDDLLDRIKRLAVTGPFPMSDNGIYFPAPRDLIIHGIGEKRQIMSLRPMPLKEGEGCNLPHRNLWPIAVTEDVKPTAMPEFWSVDRVADWLSQDRSREFEIPEKRMRENGFLAAFSKEERVHVQISPSSFVADEGKLFSTEGLAISAVDMPHRPEQVGVVLSARVESTDETLKEKISSLNVLHPLGGERRLAYFKSRDDLKLWDCPCSIAKALPGASGVRMVLASPALFANGWLPGWLNQDTLEGSPPDCTIRLKLRGACVGRWQPISGWSLEKGSRGPKPVRRLVPEGSVYFFEVVSGKPEELADLWLRSVADAEQDRRDGFGTSLWGVWILP